MGVVCSNATRGSFFKVVSKIARGRQWRKREKEAAVIIKDILKRLIPGLISKFFSPGCREGKGISPGGKKTPSLERLPMLVDPDLETSDRGGSRETESRCAMLWKLDGGAEGGGQRDQIHEVRRRVCSARE